MKNGGGRYVGERRENSGKGWVIQHLDLGSTRTCQDSGVIIALWQMSVSQHMEPEYILFPTVRHGVQTCSWIEYFKFFI